MPKKIKVSKYIAEKIARKKSDFKVDTFCSGGPGGQAQNKRKTGIRITDKITGLSSESRDATGADDNKSRAFFKLVDKMVAHYQKELSDLTIKELSPEGNIRTYRMLDDKCTDKRINDKEFSTKSILDGKLDEIHERIQIAKTVESYEN